MLEKNRENTLTILTSMFNSCKAIPPTRTLFHNDAHKVEPIAVSRHSEQSCQMLFHLSHAYERDVPARCWVIPNTKHNRLPKDGTFSGLQWQTQE